MKIFFSRPLWIDSLYGSNNSNLPSIYDDSYARIRRSNVTTTNDYHLSTLVAPIQKSTDQINEISKYSLTDVILQGPSLQDTCVSDSKLSEKPEQKELIKNSIRRIQSDFTIPLNTNNFLPSTFIETPSMTDTNLTKRSKSMIEIRSNINPTITENHQTEISSPMNMPIPGCRSILQMLEHVFADDDETTDMITEQPESLEPLLPNKRYSTKSIEQQDETTIPTRFRRTHSNQGRRRRRTSRRATCKD